MFFAWLGLLSVHPLVTQQEGRNASRQSETYPSHSHRKDTSASDRGVRGVSPPPFLTVQWDTFLSCETSRHFTRIVSFFSAMLPPNMTDKDFFRKVKEGKGRQHQSLHNDLM
mmetsp:Transcript_10215/g.19799  ORF Transcript_10215/g.19799 Transcript_10215/m.19799 type:complete len:112 (-) Transcript_10215:2014-2349(-)